MKLCIGFCGSRFNNGRPMTVCFSITFPAVIVNTRNPQKTEHKCYQYRGSVVRELLSMGSTPTYVSVVEFHNGKKYRRFCPHETQTWQSIQNFSSWESAFWIIEVLYPPICLKQLYNGRSFPFGGCAGIFPFIYMEIAAPYRHASIILTFAASIALCVKSTEWHYISSQKRLTNKLDQLTQSHRN